MATCISRRASADRNTIRLIDTNGTPGRHIWLEYRCPNSVSQIGDLCKECSCKLPKYKYQANPKCNHGKIGGAYHEDSKLYGSEFYLNLIKKGWKILEEDEIRAKAAVDKACSEMPRVKKPVVEETVKPEITITPEPTLVVPIAAPVKQKRAYKKKTPEEKVAKVAKSIKSGKPVELKVELTVPEVLLTKETYEPKFIETMTPPITISEFIVVKVRKLKCQGKEYYYDSNSGKVYGISVNGVGAYKGRYDIENDIVNTSFPDSDVDE